MNYATLIRKTTGDDGTFGEISFMGKRLFTLELPYRDTDKDGKSDTMVSCIEEGVYPVSWELSPRFQRNYYRLGKTGHRTGVLIHAANFAGDLAKGYDSQLNGCISVGHSIGELLNSKGKMQNAVLDSRSALAVFEQAMDHDSFTLIIQSEIKGA